MFRADWRFLTTQLLWPSLLASLGTSGLQIVLARMLQNLKAEQFQAVIQDCGWLTLTIVLLTVAQWIVAMRSTAIYRVVFGIDKTFQEALKYSSRRKWAIFSIFTCGSLIPAIVVVCVLLIVALIVAVRSVISLGVWGQVISITFAFVGGLLIALATAAALLITSLLFAAISSENEKLGAVFRRAFELFFKYPLRGGSYMSLLSVCVFFMMFALSFFLVPFEIYQSYLVTKDPDVDWPFYLRVLETVSQTINNIVSMAIVIIASGLYYRDVQFRFKGTDLLERLNKLDKSMNR